MKPIVSAFFAMQIALLGFGVAAMGQTIKVGVVTPLTGRYAAIGNELNTDTTLPWRKSTPAACFEAVNWCLLLELIVLDDESDATKTVARLETHAAQGVVAYLGGVGSDFMPRAPLSLKRIGFLTWVWDLPWRAFTSKDIAISSRLFGSRRNSPQRNLSSSQWLDRWRINVPKKVALFLEKTDWGQENGVMGIVERKPGMKLS